MNKEDRKEELLNILEKLRPFFIKSDFSGINEDISIEMEAVRNELKALGV